MMRRRSSSSSPENGMSPPAWQSSVMLARGGEALDRAAAVREQIVEVEVAHLKLDVSGIGARQIQQIVDQPREAPRFVEDDRQRFAILRGACGRCASATSASPRMTESGVRSSCDASATKRRMVSNDWSTRASSSLNDAASTRQFLRCVADLEARVEIRAADPPRLLRHRVERAPDCARVSR